MIKNKITYIMFLLLLLSTFSVLAVDYDDYYRINEESNLTIPCYDTNNNLCNSTVTCNITLLAQDNSIIVDNQAMTRTSAYYYFTFEPSTFGEHNALVYCNIGDEYGNTNKLIMINGNGYNNSDSSSIMGFMIGLIIFGLVLTIFFFIMDNVFKYLFLLLTMIFVVVLTYFSWVLFMASSFAGILYSLYWVFLILTLLMFLTILVEFTIFAINWFAQKKLNKDNLVDNRFKR